MALPVHCDLPELLTRQGNPGDRSNVVVRVNTTEDHHTAFVPWLTRGESENLLLKKEFFSEKDTAKQWFSLRIQVHGEEILVDQALLHHVVKQGCSTGNRNGWVSQAQNAISTHELHVGSLSLAQAKDLVFHSDPTHLAVKHKDGTKA